ncbi:MAG TPA: D-hexose-6-phosphate mutarotase [Mariprofundaceae bacterium]|nr:D-hexose-6-phosphate mutarotase [Mariprofundaceae bacterium]
MHDPDPSALDARFGVPGRVSFHDVNGIAVVEITHAAASARIAMQGAQLMTWAPTGMEPVIWLSPRARLAPGVAIRGGVPVCWPWFGPHASEPSLPSHGFARTAPWELLQVEPAPQSTELLFRLSPGDVPGAPWPQAAELQLRLAIGAGLEMELVTRNRGDRPLTIGQALHTYFGVGDVRRVRIEGLDGCPYIDKVAGGRRGIQRGAVTIDGEVDRIYLDATADCVIDDPVLARRIRIAKRGSRSTVVWNPWADKAAKMGDVGENGYLHMVCVESGNVADDVVTVAPGSVHRLWVGYSVEG